MGLFKKFNHTKMIVIAEQKFKEFYNFGMTIEEKKTDLVDVAASAIFFDEARNSRITKDEVYKIILGLKDDSPFLKFADNEMSRVAIAKTCEGVYDFFLSEMISESNPVTALYNAIDKYHCSRRKEDAESHFSLGDMYFSGQGVPQDYKEAVKWYRRAAEQGSIEAQYNLGVSYRDGQGVPRNYAMAHMYWNIASESGHKNAIRNRDILEKKMTPSQIEKAQKLAREWMQNHQ